MLDLDPYVTLILDLEALMTLTPIRLKSYMKSYSRTLYHFTEVFGYIIT